MFYTYAEKQGNVFFDGWQMRQAAFDTMRRYLYYSDAVTAEKIAYPNANGSPISATPSRQSTGLIDDTASAISLGGPSEEVDAVSPVMVQAALSPVRQQQTFVTAPPPPNRPEEVHWRKKIKVDTIVLVGKEHLFLLEDSHLKENDLFQVEIHGETRPMASGEAPSPGPLLCPSAGLSGLPERCTIENGEYIRDPFFFRELYESLRDQFSNLRLQREQAELTSGQPVAAPAQRRIQTLESPRGRNSAPYRGSRIKIILRMRTEYEFRRFWYVVQTVLGYDKLITRPYRGLPPYDPRNGLIFAQIPMCIWHTFKTLDKAVFYTFLRGDVVGRNPSGDLATTIRGAYLCITHDTVLVLRDTGNIPRWIKLLEVKEFIYNASSTQPFVAFLSDSSSPDIIFIPRPPIFGANAIRQFNAKLEVRRILSVVHETCFASLGIRRVIAIKETPIVSIRAFIARYEQQAGRQLNFAPVIGYTGAISCPLPKEQLAQVWQEVQQLSAARDAEVVRRSAIPLYENNTNDVALTPAQLETLSRRLARERSSSDDIVGCSYAEAQQIPAQPMQLPDVRSGDSATAAASSRHRDPSLSSSRGISHSAYVLNEQDESMGSSSISRTARVTGSNPLGNSRHGSSSTAAASAASESSGSPVANSRRQSSRMLGSVRGSVADATSPISARGASLRSVGHNGTANAAEERRPHPDTRERLPMERLGTPQVSSGAAVLQMTSPLMAASPSAPNLSFAGSFGGNSVQYQVPGARYLTAEELEGQATVGSGGVVVDRHVELQGCTPLGREGAAHAFLTNSELTVESIVNHSLTAMQAAPYLAEGRGAPGSDAAGRGMKSGFVKKSDSARMTASPRERRGSSLET